jgi:hypothetical protein
MKNFTLPEEILVKVLNYLATRPYNEVAQLIQDVQGKATPVAEEKED